MRGRKRGGGPFGAAERLLNPLVAEEGYVAHRQLSLMGFEDQGSGFNQQAVGSAVVRDWGAGCLGAGQELSLHPALYRV